MPYGENVAGDVDTMSRWAKVRTKRVEALTRCVTSIAFTRGRTARSAANAARTDDGVVAAACADDDIDNIKDNDAVATAGNDVDVVGIIDDGVDVGVFSTGIDNSDNVDADTDAVIEIVDDGVGFVGAGLDTADSADTGSVVQSDRAMLQSTVDPLSVDGSCSINRLGGGTEDGGLEQNAGVEHELGSVSSNEDVRSSKSATYLILMHLSCAGISISETLVSITLSWSP